MCELDYYLSEDNFWNFSYNEDIARKEVCQQYYLASEDIELIKKGEVEK